MLAYGLSKKVNCRRVCKSCEDGARSEEVSEVNFSLRRCAPFYMLTRPHRCPTEFTRNCGINDLQKMLECE